MLHTEIQTPHGPHTATALNLSDNGPALHFYHANGFGPECYMPFLSHLTPHYAVSALKMRPLWPTQPMPVARKGWRQYGDDLIAWLDHQNLGPIIAVGHSMGAIATAYAANARPDLFRALVLIEPAGAKRMSAALLHSLPYRYRHRIKVVDNALRRHMTWSDPEHAFSHMRQDPVYKRFDDAQLRHLVTATTTPHESGLVLEYPRHWENHNYLTAPYSLPALTRLSVPTHIIMAKPSFFSAPETTAKLKAKRPDIEITHMPTHGHLLPLEAPDAAAKATLEAVAQLANSTADPAKGLAKA